jgi:UDP-N-acetylmuramoyl-tripeptide--D-alanyl-D-alanine ligase
MISWVLCKEFKVLKNEGTRNNHIGLPQALLGLGAKHDVAVLELGTNHFGEIGYLASIALPTVAAITNIGPSHLEHLKDLPGVYKEKSSLFGYLQRPAAALLNHDDLFLRGHSSAKACSFSFAIENPADFRATSIAARGAGTSFIVNGKHKFSINTPGAFNVYNALLAIACARILGLDYPAIARRLASFQFPPSRLNLMDVEKVRFLNDTYNANPLSMAQALESFRRMKVAGRKILVMGDMLELGKEGESFHREAGKAASGVCDCLIFVGELSGHAAEAAREAGFDLSRIFTCENSSQARHILKELLLPCREDLVLVKGSRGMKMEEVLKA